MRNQHRELIQNGYHGACVGVPRWQPWYTVMVIVLSAVAGGMIFDEFAEMDDFSISLFWLGGTESRRKVSHTLC
jgi:hypothetical protein